MILWECVVAVFAIMMFLISGFADGDLLFLCFAKEKVSKKKGDPALPCFLKNQKFVLRKFAELAALKQTQISYKFLIFQAAKKGTRFVLSSILSAVKNVNIFHHEKQS